MKKKFLLAIVGVMLCATSAFATPIQLEFRYVDPGQVVGGHFIGFYEGNVQAGSYVVEINDVLTYGYCVDTLAYAPKAGMSVPYELVDLPDDIMYKRAAWIMQNNLPTPTTDSANVNAQVAIWEIISTHPSTIYGNSAQESHDFWVESWTGYGSRSGAQSIVDAVLGLNLDNFAISNFKLAKSEAYQDFLVYMPVPEPATMLLFGAGLIGLATFGRKKVLRRG